MDSDNKESALLNKSHDSSGQSCVVGWGGKAYQSVFVIYKDLMFKLVIKIYINI